MHVYGMIVAHSFVIIHVYRNLLRGFSDKDLSALLLYTVQQGWSLIQREPGSVSREEIEELRDLAAHALTMADKGKLFYMYSVYISLRVAV